MKNRTRENCTSGSVRDEDGNILIYSATYLGRVTKAHILDAVREAVSDEAADGMADMKKQDMAEAAEQSLVGTGWLPVLMRTPRAAQEPAEHPQADAVTETNPDGYSVAAE